MEGVAQPVESAFGFDDLVLGPAALRQLADFVSWRMHAPRILDDWGLGPIFSRRRGAVALFRGPPGTGKTMAASVIANAIGLPLYRIDFAGLISKYIGETEKNLERVFAAAAASDVVLFFDEADALFGKRAEVSDAHDRYANIETSYLLQRIEAQDGAVILATNLQDNIDTAFLRRIDIVVDFPAPGPADRLRLWRRLSATRAPLAPDLDLGFLAENFELTGGEIRNVLIAAAHAAAREDCAIGMGEIMRALAQEWQKLGRPLRRPSFGPHYRHLRATSS
jgi:SpoVK/Ycf46/Vps4 family AAA+-type ATPase